MKDALEEWYHCTAISNIWFESDGLLLAPRRHCMCAVYIYASHFWRFTCLERVIKKIYYLQVCAEGICKSFWRLIIDQYVGICDQGDKPKHVILPNFNKIKKILVFWERQRNEKHIIFGDSLGWKESSRGWDIYYFSSMCRGHLQVNCFSRKDSFRVESLEDSAESPTLTVVRSTWTEFTQIFVSTREAMLQILISNVENLMHGEEYYILIEKFQGHW